MKMLIALCFTLTILPVIAEEVYQEVTLEQLSKRPEHFLGKKIKVTGKVLGTVYATDKEEANLWVVVLGNRAQPNEKLAKQLIFPGYHPKIRAAEDGFNKDVLDRAENLLSAARADGTDVTLYGSFHPNAGTRQYARGISLALERIETGPVTIDTDYGDVSAFTAKTPGRIKKAVSGGKRIAKAVGKFF